MKKELILLQDGNTMYRDRFEGKLKRIVEVMNEKGMKTTFHPTDMNVKDIKADAVLYVDKYNEYVVRYAMHDDKYHIVLIEERNNHTVLAINFVY